MPVLEWLNFRNYFTKQWRCDWPQCLEDRYMNHRNQRCDERSQKICLPLSVYTNLFLTRPQCWTKIKIWHIFARLILTPSACPVIPSFVFSNDHTPFRLLFQPFYMRSNETPNYNIVIFKSMMETNVTFVRTIGCMGSLLVDREVVPRDFVGLKYWNFDMKTSYSTPSISHIELCQLRHLRMHSNCTELSTAVCKSAQNDLLHPKLKQKLDNFCFYDSTATLEL